MVIRFAKSMNHSLNWLKNQSQRFFTYLLHKSRTKSVIFSAYKPRLSYLLIVAFSAKLMVYGYDLSDAMAALFVLTGAICLEVVSYYFPKRPDVYQELKDIKRHLSEIQGKSDDMERDVMGLKMGVRR